MQFECLAQAAHCSVRNLLTWVNRGNMNQGTAALGSCCPTTRADVLLPPLLLLSLLLLALLLLPAPRRVIHGTRKVCLCKRRVHQVPPGCEEQIRAHRLGGCLTIRPPLSRIELHVAGNDSTQLPGGAAEDQRYLSTSTSACRAVCNGVRAPSVPQRDRLTCMNGAVVAQRAPNIDTRLQGG